jgi:hypothetical protein
MTMTPQLLRTTIQIRRGVHTALTISYDYTSLGIEIPAAEKFQLLIDQAARQWWDSLNPSQRSVLGEQGLSLLISARCRELPRS